MPRPKTPNLPTLIWPEIQGAYIDEFGPVDIEIYNLAGDMWPSVQSRILRTINNLQEGQRLMLKAVAIVTRRRNEQPERMTNLTAYLFVIFCRLLLEEQRRQSGHDQLDANTIEGLGNQKDSDSVDINQAILVREILDRADAWTREIYEYLILGYSYEEIAPKLGMRANRLRSIWSKKIGRLKKQIEQETRTSQRRTGGQPGRQQ
ncbi:MAG: RNA polymerase sigma factor [Pyrinomonadaceae bacterium]